MDPKNPKTKKPAHRLTPLFCCMAGLVTDLVSSTRLHCSSRADALLEQGPCSPAEQPACPATLMQQQG